MSRPVKFRAWDNLEKVMVYDVLAITGDTVRFGRTEYEKYYGKQHEFYGKKSFDIFLQTEPMQFTGLKDSKGVEIWEGDVVKFDAGNGFRGTGEVFFRDGSFMHRYREEVDPDSWRQPKSFRKDVKYEVIGNVYENPKLLGE